MSVTEEELANAAHRADRIGLYACPHTGVALGGLEKLVAAGKIDKEEEPLEIQIEHEALVTSLIHAIYAAARKEDDFRTESFLRWFVDEQAEEEEHSRNLLQEFKFAEKADALIDLDRALAERK